MYLIGFSTAQISQQVHSFNWHNPSWDLFIFLFWVVASIIYTFAAGRGRIINILISIYLAQLLVLQAPFLTKMLGSRLDPSTVYLSQLITFLVLFFALLLLLGRYVFRSSADGRQVTSFFFGLIFSILQIGLLINIVLGYLPADLKNRLADLTQTLFVNDPASFIWMIAPIIYLAVLGKFISHGLES